MRPSNMTSTRSESARISLSSAETSEHRAALVALGDEPLVDVFGRADVEAARRLLGDQHWCLVRQFARDDDLLQIAARQRPDRTALAWDADGEAADERARPLGERARNDEGAARERRRRAGSPWQDCRRRWRRRRADGGAILRNIGEAGGAMRLDVRAGSHRRRRSRPARRPGAAGRPAPRRVRSARCRRRPRSRRSRRRERSRLTRSTAGLPAAPATVRSTASSSGAPRRARPLLDLQIDVAPGHCADDLARVGLGRSQARDRAAVAQDRHPIGDRHRLVELVGDEQHRAALGGEAAQHAEQRVALRTASGPRSARRG